jgi:hypothetical protein
VDVGSDDGKGIVLLAFLYPGHSVAKPSLDRRLGRFQAAFIETSILLEIPCDKLVSSLGEQDVAGSNLPCQLFQFRIMDSAVTPVVPGKLLVGSERLAQQMVGDWSSTAWRPAGDLGEVDQPLTRRATSAGNRAIIPLNVSSLCDCAPTAVTSALSNSGNSLDGGCCN